MITKENSNRAGARDAGSVTDTVATLIGSNGHCNLCGQKLQGIPCLPQRLVAHVCNNIFCDLDRSPQFYTDIPADQVPHKKPPILYRTPARCCYQEQTKENYRLLRSLHVPSVKAAIMKTNKQTKIYLESIGYECGK